MVEFFNKKGEITNIEKFIKDFEDLNIDDKELDFLKTLNLNPENLFILAQIFIKNGDFEKAINLYLIALKNIKNDKNKKEFILTNLGKIYFKAGFLQKCNEILFKALKLNPRNEEALKYLMVSYEKLRLYDDELDVLEVLEALGVNVINEKNYVKSLQILNNKKLSFKEKILRLNKFYYKDTPRIILETYIKANEDLNLIKEFPKLSECIDLLWYVTRPINLEDDDYNALFFIKNLSQKSTNSTIFELNALSAMKKSNFLEGSLKFKFICQKCKAKIPLFFYRCPMCYNLGTINIVSEISKGKNETNISL